MTLLPFIAAAHIIHLMRSLRMKRLRVRVRSLIVRSRKMMKLEIDHQDHHLANKVADLAHKVIDHHVLGHVLGHGTDYHSGIEMATAVDCKQY